MMFPTVAPEIVSSADCDKCRKCCVFSEEELSEPPLFTDEQRDRVISEFPELVSEFSRKGKVWFISLQPIPHSKEYVCPLFDRPSAKCKIYSFRPFDCHTWPFYIMQMLDTIVIAVSNDCPITNERNPAFIDWFARNVIGPKMVEAARKQPDFVLPFRGNVRVVYEVENFR